MANVAGQVANLWGELHATTLPDYLKTYEDLTIRDRAVLALMKKKGRITYNHSGTQLEPIAKFDESDLNPYADNGKVEYARKERTKRLAFYWSAYTKTGKVTKQEKLINRGQEALVKYTVGMIDTLMGEMKNQFPGEFYKDGYANGNENRLIGFESMFGSGTTVDADIIAKPSDTYGGHSTAVGQDSSNWTTNLSTKPNADIATDWPDGQGAAAYDWNSPKLLNYSSSSAFGTSSSAWSANCEKALRRHIAFCTRTGGREGRPSLGIFTSTMFSELKDLLSSRMQIRPGEVNEGTELGFPDALMFEGVMLHQDFDIPANSYYLLNLDQAELACQEGQMFNAQPAAYDPFTFSDLFAVTFFGQLWTWAKYQGKGANYA